RSRPGSVPRGLTRFLWPAAIAAAVSLAPPALADDSEDLRHLRDDLEAERHAREALEQRLAAMEKSAAAPTAEETSTAVERYLGEKDLFAGAPVEAKVPSGGTLLDFSVILDSHFGTSTATDAALGFIALGDHDPHVRGANVRNEELVASADVDPY